MASTINRTDWSLMTLSWWCIKYVYYYTSGYVVYVVWWSRYTKDLMYYICIHKWLETDPQPLQTVHRWPKGAKLWTHVDGFGVMGRAFRVWGLMYSYTWGTCTSLRYYRLCIHARKGATLTNMNLGRCIRKQSHNHTCIRIHSRRPVNTIMNI